LDVDGVKPGKVSVQVVDVEFPCLHVTKVSPDAETVATRTTGSQDKQDEYVEKMLHSLL
jgi:hypothetical protein